MKNTWVRFFGAILYSFFSLWALAPVFVNIKRSKGYFSILLTSEFAVSNSYIIFIVAALPGAVPFLVFWLLSKYLSGLKLALAVFACLFVMPFLLIVPCTMAYHFLTGG